MSKLMEHKLGSVVDIEGRAYSVVKAKKSQYMCSHCALESTLACLQVACSPIYREDRTQVYYVEEGGEK
jgi:hypothetical protein